MTTETKPTKTKRILLRDECQQPPREIRDNTKARRQWLADKVIEIAAQPNREAKIVGTGSYQSVSVYEVKEVEGRLRLRGACQFCGNSQVVSSGHIVLHGYNRPGDGQIFGECPGMRKRSLNESSAYTEKWLAEYTEQHKKALTDKAEAEQVKTVAAAEARKADDTTESNAYTERPRRQQKFYTTRRLASIQQIDEYKSAMKLWAEQFPKHAASEAADRKYELAREFEWKARGMKDHFTELLARNITGTPLTEEVVA